MSTGGHRDTCLPSDHSNCKPGEFANGGTMSDVYIRLAKIEATQADLADDVAKAWAEIPELKRRLDGLAANMPSGVAGTNGGKEPGPSSGAAAVCQALQDIDVAHGVTWNQCRTAYSAAVEHYRKAVPHLTLDELKDAMRLVDFWHLKDDYEKIAANRRPPE